MVNGAGFNGRRERVVSLLATHEPGLDALLVTGAENRRYLSGFTGSWGMLLVTAAEMVLLTDGRYIEQAVREAPGCRVVRHGPEPTAAVKETVDAIGLSRLGFEAENVSVSAYEKIGRTVPGVSLIPTQGLVEAGRAVKEDGELELIQRAATVTDDALHQVLPCLKTGISERDLALELELALKRSGAGLAFEVIVVSGPRSSLPHGRASERVLAVGDLVTIDVGARVDGYCSDLTRTFVLGKPDQKQQEVYTTVLQAQTAALDALRPGMTGKEADVVAREVITARGYGEYFSHGLGHGVGLAVHEGPRLSPLGDVVLEEGNVVTVEPGIYIAGWGGIRIEDLVVLRTSGAECLSGFPRELLALH